MLGFPAPSSSSLDRVTAAVRESQQTTLFVMCPTERVSMAQGPFKVGLVAMPYPNTPGGSKNASSTVGILLDKQFYFKQFN